MSLILDHIVGWWFHRCLVGPIIEDDDLSDKYVSVQMDLDGLKAPNGFGITEGRTPK